MTVCNDTRRIVGILLVNERHHRHHLDSRWSNSDSIQNCDNFLVKPSWRKTMLAWMYGLTMKCPSLSREAVSVAAIYLETSIACGLIHSPTTFKVVSITCLFLATKLIDSMAVTLDDLIRLCRGEFSATDVVRMELPIIQALKWRLHPATPNCFLHQFLCFFPRDTHNHAVAKVHEVSQLVIELVSCHDTSLCTLLPSEIAFCAVLTAMEFVAQVEDLRVRHRQVAAIRIRSCTGTKSNHFTIRRAVGELAILLIANDSTSMRLTSILGDAPSTSSSDEFDSSEQSCSWPKHGRIKLSPVSLVSFGEQPALLKLY